MTSLGSINPDSYLYQSIVQSQQLNSSSQSQQSQENNDYFATQDSLELGSQNYSQPTTYSNSFSGMSSTPPPNPLDSLVTNGTITKDQETAIQNAFKSAMQSQSSSNSTSSSTNPLDSLVSNGTITQDQESSIQNQLEMARLAYQRY